MWFWEWMYGVDNDNLTKLQDLISMKKDHLYFKNPLEGVTVFKQKSRFNPNSTEKDEEKEEIMKDYIPKKEDFERSLISFERKRKLRKERKTISIPENIELIKINFHDIFDSSGFENIYRNNFGLDIISYTDWNTKAIFAISDYEKFKNFIKQLEIFIDTENHFNPKYDKNIKFIKEFDFLSSDLIKNYSDFKKHIIINLIDSLELDSIKNKIEERLIHYLEENEINFNSNFELNCIELINIEEEIIIKIIDNFDIIQSVNSYSSGLVKPNSYNLSEKSYGFQIINNDSLPIIGIIDTGIEKNSPLKTILINDESYNLTKSSPFIDNVDHGSAVATIAALGDKLYPNHFGEFESDARLLSIKTLDKNSGQIFESDVINLIRKAKLEYNVQIFTLTIGYSDYKKHNEKVSNYAHALDKLSYELNILIFISICNVFESKYYFDNIQNKSLFPKHYETEQTNLCSPAESMNNITVGAFASNLENNDLFRITPVGTVPGIYSRTFHINWDLNIFKDKNGDFNHRRTNKKLFFKPDVISYGGDYDNYFDVSKTGLKVLTTEIGGFFNREIGTSYSAPFVANLAARILKKYPELSDNMQTIKALIINSSEIKEKNEIIKDIESSVIGNGLPNEQNCLNSTEDRITFILEDRIDPETIKCFSLLLPSYLLDLTNPQSIIEFTSTLCFSFSPINKSQFTYCPIHLAFGFFDNLPLEQYKTKESGEILKNANGTPQESFGINYNAMDKIKLKNSWSQDYYYKPKVLSNSQKVSFKLTKKFLEKNVDNNGNIKVKIALNCKCHKLLDEIEKINLKSNSIKFSLVTTIEELPYKSETTGRLYQEMKLINNLEIINELKLDVEN